MQISDSTAQSAEAKVRTIVARLAQAERPDEMPEDADLFETIGVQSSATLELLITLEDEFNVSIPDSDFVHARTVSALVKLVTERQ